MSNYEGEGEEQDGNIEYAVGEPVAGFIKGGCSTTDRFSLRREFLKSIVRILLTYNVIGNIL